MNYQKMRHMLTYLKPKDLTDQALTKMLNACKPVMDGRRQLTGEELAAYKEILFIHRCEKHRRLHDYSTGGLS